MLSDKIPFNSRMPTIKYFFTAILLCMPILTGLFAQVAPDLYWLEFTDKQNSPYSLNNPGEFLSQRALERREQQKIAVTEQDIPVNKAYTDSLLKFNLEIILVSKWMNGSMIRCADTNTLNAIQQLTFVKQLDRYQPASETKSSKADKNNAASEPAISANYHTQIEMLGLDYLHNQGINGKGVLIGILDAGFQDVQIVESLRHLWDSNKVLAMRDFVQDDQNMLSNHTHGTLILSILAGWWPDKLAGSAPGAQYVLLRTEKGDTEYLAEEYSWLAGAEFADSIGVDVINSSLGYYSFFDSRQNHEYQDLDGRTAPVTLAALHAARRGMLVINSAGNEGDDPWFQIIAPADADSILSVGAVDFQENITKFSSRGPSSDGRIKPDVSAMGQKTYGQTARGSVSTYNGTSCSAPLITGLAATLKQNNWQCNAMQLRQAIIESSDRYQNPDNEYGYGIPDAVLANAILSESKNEPALTDIILFPNPTHQNLYVRIILPWLQRPTSGMVYGLDLAGRKMFQFETEFDSEMNFFEVPQIPVLDAGFYMLYVEVDGRFYSLPFIKID